MSQRTREPGNKSSEFRKAKLSELVGLVLIALGVVLSVVAGLLERELLVGAGVVFVAAGAYLAGHTAAAYAHSRGAVKAAELLPPSTVVSPLRVGAGRL